QKGALMETEIVSESNEVDPEPNLERRTRRQFSGAEKKRLIEEMDALPVSAAKSTLLPQAY
ncbi:MAG TPA: hypothetical protein VKA50_09325, partial [Gammaproteobacteria bacterium]|nr:hypothetical protein [Gammaproteobacteria bacterium]